LGAHEARAISLDFSSVPGASLQFQGSTFQFAGGGFSVGNSDGAGDSIGLLGSLSGIFTIGPITDWGGGLQTAPVTGSGTFSISDGTFSLLATLTWIDISTMDVAGGTNIFGVSNLSGITYGGSNADLLAIASAGTGAAAVSFQFIPARSLEVLTDGTLRSASYSGSVVAASVPDGASTFALFGVAVVGLEGLRRKLKLA
jgi:hypothetical protein